MGAVVLLSLLVLGVLALTPPSQRAGPELTVPMALPPLPSTAAQTTTRSEVCGAVRPLLSVAVALWPRCTALVAVSAHALTLTPLIHALEVASSHDSAASPRDGRVGSAGATAVDHLSAASLEGREQRREMVVDRYHLRLDQRGRAGEVCAGGGQGCQRVLAEVLTARRPRTASPAVAGMAMFQVQTRSR